MQNTAILVVIKCKTSGVLFFSFIFPLNIDWGKC